MFESHIPRGKLGRPEEIAAAAASRPSEITRRIVALHVDIG
jgi:hypothetical protein